MNTIPQKPSNTQPIRRLLRDKVSRRFYLLGDWIDDRNLAQNFLTWAVPHRVALSHSDKELEMVFSSELQPEVLVPITALARLGVVFQEREYRPS